MYCLKFTTWILLLFCVQLDALELVVVRHGETEWNRLRKYQGQMDIPLNETGREQAQQTRTALQNMHFDAAYCSDLSRAQETAQIVLEGRDLTPQADSRWREVCYGDFEGGPSNEADTQRIIQSLHLPKGQEQYGVESLEGFVERLRSVLADIMCRHRHDERVLVVAHNGVLRSLTETIMQNEANAPLRFQNCGYIVAELDAEGGAMRVLRFESGESA